MESGEGSWRGSFEGKKPLGAAAAEPAAVVLAVAAAARSLWV